MGEEDLKMWQEKMHVFTEGGAALSSLGNGSQSEHQAKMMAECTTQAGDYVLGQTK